MSRFFRGCTIVWVVLRYGLDELVLSSFQHPWLHRLRRVLTIGRKLDAPRGQRLRAQRFLALAGGDAVVGLLGAGAGFALVVAGVVVRRAMGREGMVLGGGLMPRGAAHEVS